jgi:uncharacterized protein YndB with AHSA1/START domain
MDTQRDRPMPNKLKITAQGDREIVFIRDFAAPRPKVWRALTEPALIKKWLGAMPNWTFPVCEVDLRVGGTYRYEWKNVVDGMTMGMGGKFLEIQAPERLVATERFDEAWYPGEAIDTQVLTERNGRTTLTLTVQYDSKEARDGVMAGPATSGMESGYNIMEELLQTL